MAKKAKSAARRRARAPRVAPRRTYRILVDMSPHERAAALGEFRIDHCCMPQPRRDASGAWRLHGFATGSTIASLRRSGRKVEVLADAQTEGRRLQRFIGKGDRFEGGRRGPTGVGKLV
jgi:hypothetical protein